MPVLPELDPAGAGDQLRSLARPAELEIDKIKGSRFIGYAYPALTMTAWQECVAQVQGVHPSARHLCFAWRGEHEDLHRHSDAGEPRGSAGPPILRALESFELYACGVVVVRYFGGTKLGVGGLIRAYGACARAVLDTAEIELRTRMATLLLHFAPDKIGAVNGCLLSHGLQPPAPHFDHEVHLSVEAPAAQVSALMAALKDACAGQIAFGEPDAPRY